MASPQLIQVSIPSDFSEFERSLVKKTEVALVDGLALERWSRDPNRKVEFHPLTLNRKYDLPNKAYGYFGDVTISGRQLTALGARQEVEFGKITGPNCQLADHPQHQADRAAVVVAAGLGQVPLGDDTQLERQTL